jgi:hypothetical protein
VSLIHISLNLKDKGGEIIVKGIYCHALCNSWKGRCRHLEEMLKEGLDAEVIKS